MELKDSHQNQAHPTDLQDRICEGASNIIGNIKLNSTQNKHSSMLYSAVWSLNQLPMEPH